MGIKEIGKQNEISLCTPGETLGSIAVKKFFRTASDLQRFMRGLFSVELIAPTFWRT